VRSVTLDSNVYISALQFGGKPMQLLDMAINGEIEIAVSQPIITEVGRVLEKKFHWPEQDIEDAKVLIITAAKWVEPKVTVAVVKDDPDDDRIVECAVESGSEAIITDDGDLLRDERLRGDRDDEGS